MTQINCRSEPYCLSSQPTSPLCPQKVTNRMPWRRQTNNSRGNSWALKIKCNGIIAANPFQTPAGRGPSTRTCRMAYTCARAHTMAKTRQTPTQFSFGQRVNEMCTKAGRHSGAVTVTVTGTATLTVTATAPQTQIHAHANAHSWSTGGYCRAFDRAVGGVDNGVLQMAQQLLKSSGSQTQCTV